MLVTCKNTCCKYYYQLKKGQHCPAEEGCPGYTRNKRKADRKIPKCKECEYCKRIITNDGKEYHYACTYMNRNKVRKKQKSYSDGIAELYRKKDPESNVKSLDDLEHLGFLYYTEKSNRQQDVEFAQQLGTTLSLKIATPDDGNMDSSRNVVIGDTIYAIIYIDRSRAEQELYFYLEEVRKIE